MTTPLQAAVVGYGGSGRSLHGRLLASLPEFEVTAIVSKSRRNVALLDHPTARILADMDGVVALASEIDLVVVATPDASHEALGLAALEAGLPTVIEKPLAPTAEQALRLSDAAKAAGVPLVAFQNKRWDADFATVRQVVQSGILGDILRYEAWITRWSPGIWENWRQEARPGTLDGPLADIGSHMVDHAVSLFGPVRSVTAELDRHRPHSAVDDDGFLALHHVSGVRTHLHFGAMTSHQTPTFQVQGMLGSLQTTGQDGQFLAMMHDVGPSDPAWGTLGTWEAELRLGEDTVPVERIETDAREFYRGLARTLREGGPSPVPLDETLHVIHVLDAARRSADSGGSPVQPLPLLQTPHY